MANPIYSRKNERQIIRTMARARLMEPLDNDTKNQLRKIAIDNGSPVVRRLYAIDRLACDGGVYNSISYHTEAFVPTGTRAQRFVIHALRLVLKTDKPMHPSVASGIRERLAFIKMGVPPMAGQPRQLFWRVAPLQSETHITSLERQETLDEQITRILNSADAQHA